MCHVAGDLYSDHLDNSSWRCFCWRSHWHWLMNVNQHSSHMDFVRHLVMIHVIRRAEMVSVVVVDVNCFGVAMVVVTDYCYSLRNSVHVLDYRNPIHRCVLCVFLWNSAKVFFLFAILSRLEGKFQDGRCNVQPDKRQTVFVMWWMDWYFWWARKLD